MATKAVWVDSDMNESTSKLVVQFFLEAVENPGKSAEAGRPIFEDREFVRIIVPGDQTQMIVRGARQADKERFPVQYAAFKNKQEQPTVGTPLSAVPFLTKAQVAELAAVNVTTAEQLRDMSDGNAQKFMGIHGLRKRVTAFLEAAAGAAPLQKMQNELESRDSKIANLQKALEDQNKKIEELSRRK